MRRVFRKIFILLFLGLCYFAIIGKVNAASANISCPSSAQVGSPITISVTGTAVQWRLELKVDGDTIASSSELDNYTANKTISFSGKYTPKSIGSKTVTIEGSITEYSNNVTTRSFTSKTINVVAAPQPSTNPSPSTNPGGNTGNNNQGGNAGGNTAAKDTNANLKRMGFTPKEYDKFVFDGNKRQVNPVQIPHNISSINVYAEPASSKARVISGTGTRVLHDGTNTIEITVVAESGDKKIYTLVVNRENGEEGEVPPNVIDEPTEEEPETPKGLTAFEITGYELDKEFKIDVFEYVAKTEEKITKEWLEEVKKKLVYTASAEELTVEVVTDVLEDEKGTITIIVKEGETEVAKYVVTFEREKKEEKPVAALTNSSNSGNGTGGLGLTYERKIYIIIGAFGVTLATAIFFAVDSYLKTKRLEEYDEEQEFEEDSEFERMNSFYAGFTGTQDATTTSPIETNENMEYDDNTDRISDELAKDETAEETAGEVTSSLRRLGGYRNMRGSGRSSGRHF